MTFKVISWLLLFLFPYLKRTDQFDSLINPLILYEVFLLILSSIKSSRQSRFPLLNKEYVFQ